MSVRALERETNLDALESTLRDVLHELPPEPGFPKRKGRPPLLKPFLLWAGLLVCVLRGFTAQRSLWQLVSLRGLWHYPKVTLQVQAVYNRLERVQPALFLDFLERLTACLRERFATVNDVPCGRFATEVFALDHSTLDAVARKLKLLRDVPAGHQCLLPGQLAAIFDLRRQLWFRVEFWEDAQRNEKADLKHWLPFLSEGCLLLFDLGFFSFSWFDALTDAKVHFLSRLRKKTSFRIIETLFEGQAGPVHLCDRWVYLGAYRADRARHPFRLLEITLRTGQRWR